MENILANILLYMVILICLLLTFLGMMGNVWLLLSAGFYAVQEDFVKFNEEFLLFLFLVFAAGEIWNSLFRSLASSVRTFPGLPFSLSASVRFSAS